MGKGKPSGLQAARALRTHRRENRWADKAYKKRALGTAFKSSPFAGASHAKGIVLEKMSVLLIGSAISHLCLYCVIVVLKLSSPILPFVNVFVFN
jgi:hypothetical protein